MNANPFLPAQPPSGPPRHPARDAIDRIQAELNTKRPMTVSHAAWDALEEVTAEHMESVGILSAHMARRQRVTQVEDTHIQDANRRVGGLPHGSLSVFITSTAGGAAVGVGGGLIGSLLTDTPVRDVTDTAFLVAIGLTLVGLILLVVAFAITYVGNHK